LDENSIFVVDVPGVESLLEKYKSDRPICIIYFDASVYNRINRMLDRGNCDTFIISRLLQDEKEDWYKQLDSLVWKYVNILGKNVQMYSINANNNLEEVMELVLYYMKRHMED
jgi:thymidylate kinase